MSNTPMTTCDGCLKNDLPGEGSCGPCTLFRSGNLNIDLCKKCQERPISDLPLIGRQAYDRAMGGSGAAIGEPLKVV